MKNSSHQNNSVPIRRRIFATLVISTILGLVLLMYATLSTKGLSVLELLMILCFLVTLPWLVIGFWNAVIGLLLMRFANDPISKVNPTLENYDPSHPISDSTAVAICIRNEDAQMVVGNMQGILQGLDEAGFTGKNKFTFYILSDSNAPKIIGEEESLFSNLKNHWKDAFEVNYRRRVDNKGYKAGNIREFCTSWGKRHDYMLVLDADSYMSSDCILKLVRLMQSNDKLGILQSLVVGMPTTSAFARVFQFGMRLGMRSYTLGSAWWQGDCGPYWGHNAIIRLKPFMEACELPELNGTGPLSGSILSHDQVEATFMRRAGYEVRVLPEEDGSFEENPTNILEFIRRDLRWCHGNLQYFRLLRTPGLKPVSRFQLILAIIMFLGSPAWLLFMITGALTVILYGRVPIMFDDTLITGTLEDEKLLEAMLSYDYFNHTYGIITIFIVMSMVFAPKIATVIDILSRRNLKQAFGGTKNILVSTVFEILFSAILAPIMAVAHSICIFGLLLGRKVGWNTPQRHKTDISLKEAGLQLWPQTLLGVFGLGFIAMYNSGAVLFALPVIFGLVIAIPFAVYSASTYYSKRLEGSKLWCIPEEHTQPACLKLLDLPGFSNVTDLSKDESTLKFSNQSVGSGDSMSEHA